MEEIGNLLEESKMNMPTLYLRIKMSGSDIQPIVIMKDGSTRRIVGVQHLQNRTVANTIAHVIGKYYPEEMVLVQAASVHLDNKMRDGILMTHITKEGTQQVASAIGPDLLFMGWVPVPGTVEELMNLHLMFDETVRKKAVDKIDHNSTIMELWTIDFDKEEGGMYDLNEGDDDEK